MRQTAEARKKELLIETDGKCYYCGIDLTHIDCRIEHVIPKSKGGRNHKSNYVASCDKCNRFKGTKSIEELRTKILKNNPIFTFQFYYEYVGLALKGAINNG